MSPEKLSSSNIRSMVDFGKHSFCFFSYEFLSSKKLAILELFRVSSETRLLDFERHK